MRKTLILFIDAFSYTDLNRQSAPFIYDMAAGGRSGSVATIPAGYHIEYSMLSGSLPLKHNVWTWYYMKKGGSFSKIKYIKPLVKFIDKFSTGIARKIVDVYVNLIRLAQGKTRFLKTNRIPLDLLEKFEISVDKSYIDHDPLPVPTLFDVLRKNDIKYTAMEFPTVSNNKRTRLYIQGDDFKQLDAAARYLANDQVVFLHIWGLDKIEHEHGLHSEQALSYLGKVDSKVREIYDSYKGDLNVVIFSDHGGCEVTKTRNIQDILGKYDNDSFIGSTTAQIWLSNESDKEELTSILRAEDYLVYDSSNIEELLKIPYERDFVGDILVYVKPHEQLYPDFFRDTAIVKSMHGYSERVPELEGIFVMNGFNSETGEIENMKLYDIAPTILKAMDLPLPEVWDGEAK